MNKALSVFSFSLAFLLFFVNTSYCDSEESIITFREGSNSYTDVVPTSSERSALQYCIRLLIDPINTWTAQIKNGSSRSLTYEIQAGGEKQVVIIDSGDSKQVTLPYSKKSKRRQIVKISCGTNLGPISQIVAPGYTFGWDTY